MSNNLPLVTIIAACYNHEKYVLECLNAIKNQTYKNIELIITDDYSTDSSVTIINSWIEETGHVCTFISHDLNLGFPKTLNEALDNANGKYISIISTDDYWYPEFIEKRVRLFEESDDSVGVIYGKTYTIDEKGNRLPEVRPITSEPPEGYVLHDLLLGCFIIAPTAMIRKSCYGKVGLYDETLSIEDYDMWLRIARYYRFKFCPEILTNYRISPSSFTFARNEDLRISVAKIFIKQLNLIGGDITYQEAIDNKLIIYRHTLFKIKEPLARKYIRLSIIRKINKSDIFMYICSLLGLSYTFYQKISAWKNNHLNFNINN